MYVPAFSATTVKLGLVHPAELCRIVHHPVIVFEVGFRSIWFVSSFLKYFSGER